MIRLHISDPIDAERIITLSKEQAHYLSQVMRCKTGATIALFNENSGQWHADIQEISRKQVVLIAKTQTMPPKKEPDITLCFALVKQTPLINIIQKGTELGVATFQPIITERTNVKSINIDRLQRIATESAEQCCRLSIPKIQATQSLSQVLTNWSQAKPLILCDESGEAPPAMQVLDSLTPHTPLAIAIGPEGGFSESEFAILRKCPYAVPISMGPRILRADTAAIAALTCCQSKLGDWHEPPHFRY
jgi:16S rRNA (uracil1498-N3)-methyltransferase